MGRQKQGTPWQPLKRVRRIISAELAAKAREDPEIAQTIAASREMWANDQYTVIVARFPPGDPNEGQVTHLSIRRNDRRAVRDWRDFQRIKNEIAGREAEAVELYPAESRLVDGANQYHLWVFPLGMIIPLGFNERRVTDVPDSPGAKQRPGAGS